MTPVCPVDFLFLVDSSDVSGRVLFERQKELVLRVSGRLLALRSSGWRLRVRLAALQFGGGNISVQHNLRDWQDADGGGHGLPGGGGAPPGRAMAAAARLFRGESSPAGLKGALLLLSAAGPDHYSAAAAEEKLQGVRLLTSTIVRSKSQRPVSVGKGRWVILEVR
ncbi:unnamed protein product [Menidia menidia]|uniref:(Atlantic silverside) hypothetical protein n=1 Tax=Menidia menidia TaxID=238744 RepID=A0A8S4AUN0_9TELE|nr:unnamed protein product [Menidia menidia]